MNMAVNDEKIHTVAGNFLNVVHKDSRWMEGMAFSEFFMRFSDLSNFGKKIRTTINGINPQK